MQPWLLFLLLSVNAATYATFLCLRVYDAEHRWLRGSGLDIVTLALVALFSLRHIVVYLQSWDGNFKHLEIVYWVLYFFEHLVEALLWSGFSVMLQLHRGKRSVNHIEVLENLIMVTTLLIALALAVVLALFLAESQDKTAKVVRQLSLVITVALSVVEFTGVWVKTSLFHNNLLVLRPIEMKLFMLLPTTTLIVGISTCGVPVMDEPAMCSIAELWHLTVFCGVVASIWLLLIRRNDECNRPGARNCPSQIMFRMAKEGKDIFSSTPVLPCMDL